MFQHLKGFIKGIAAICAGVAWMLPATPGWAQGGAESALFRTGNISVDVTARSATEARAIAISQAHRKGFERLFTKLVAEEDQALMPVLGDAEISALVLAVDIIEERTAPTRYLATLAVGFDAAAMRQLLGSLGVSFAETRSRPMLALPVLRHAGADMLWADGNAWLAAWRAYPTQGSLIDFRLPANGLRDPMLISARQALAVQPERLAAAAAHYDVGEVLVPLAVLRRDHGAAPWQADITVTRGPARQPVLEFSVTAEPEEGLDGLLHRAIEVIDARLSEAWKQQVLVQYGQQASFAADVAFTNFAAWADIQRRLEGVAQIRELQLQALSITGAALTIDYFGGWESLRRALAERGLDLSEGEAGAWRLALASKNGSAP